MRRRPKPAQPFDSYTHARKRARVIFRIEHRDTEDAEEDEMMVNGIQDDPLTHQIIGAAIEVHRGLGPGLLESVYEECLVIELLRVGLSVSRQVSVPLVWRDQQLSHPLRIDLLVSDQVIVEVKSIEAVLKVHKAQLLSYMRLSSKKRGLLINFNVDILKSGVTRCIL
jgi:GxxExxY protein